MAINSNAKGKRGELEFCKAWEATTGLSARRGVQYQGGPDSPDVVVDVPNLHVEVKRTEKLSLYEAMDQAISDAGASVPLLAHRRNGREWLLVLPLTELLGLVRVMAHRLEQ